MSPAMNFFCSLKGILSTELIRWIRLVITNWNSFFYFVDKSFTRIQDLATKENWHLKNNVVLIKAWPMFV